MAQTFTPTSDIFSSNPKLWPSELAMLDWDSTQIVFTKRELLDFLRTAGVSVSPGFNEIQKLPKHARFYEASAAPELPLAAEHAQAATTTTAVPLSSTPSSERNASNRSDSMRDLFAAASLEDAASQAQPAPVQPAQPGFKPTRKVRDPPGGRGAGPLFGEPDEEVVVPPPPSAAAAPASEPVPEPSAAPRTSRRVRDPPGGRPGGRPGGLFDEEPAEPAAAAAAVKPAVVLPSGEAFRPTRKVRSLPGGGSTVGLTLFGGDE